MNFGNITPNLIRSSISSLGRAQRTLMSHSDKIDVARNELSVIGSSMKLDDLAKQGPGKAHDALIDAANRQTFLRATGPTIAHLAPEVQAPIRGAADALARLDRLLHESAASVGDAQSTLLDASTYLAIADGHLGSRLTSLTAQL